MFDQNRRRPIVWSVSTRMKVNYITISKKKYKTMKLEFTIKTFIAKSSIHSQISIYMIPLLQKTKELIWNFMKWNSKTPSNELK